MKGLKQSFYLLFVGVGLLISFSICLIIFFQFRSYIKTTYQDSLARICATIEKQFPELYDIETLKQGYENDEDWFWDLRQDLQNLNETFTLSYIYYIERVDSDYIVRIGTQESESFGRPAWSEGTPIPENVDNAYTTQQLMFTTKPVINERGINVAVRMPFVKDGRTVGLLNINYDIAYVGALERNMFIIMLVSLIVAVAITVALAIFGSRIVLVPVEAQEQIAREAQERGREIETLNDTLHEASLSKSAFLTNICKEISAPIHAIIGHSLVQNSNDIPKEIQKNMDIINESGVLLMNVVSDIQDINKIEAGQLQIAHEQYDLPDFIGDIAALYNRSDPGEPVVFRLDVDPNLPLKLVGDKYHIKQVCLKLLNNAFTFTAKGAVLLRVYCKRDSKGILLVFSIRDTGNGMSPEKLEQLFSGYRQIGHKAKHRAGGTGLGLHIAKQIAEMMGGKISVASELGKGTAFTFYLHQKLVSREQVGPETAALLKSFKYNNGGGGRGKNIPAAG